MVTPVSMKALPIALQEAGMTKPICRVPESGPLNRNPSATWVASRRVSAGHGMSAGASVIRTSFGNTTSPGSRWPSPSVSMKAVRMRLSVADQTSQYPAGWGQRRFG